MALKNHRLMESIKYTWPRKPTRPSWEGPPTRRQEKIAEWKTLRGQTKWGCQDKRKNKETLSKGDVRHVRKDDNFHHSIGAHKKKGRIKGTSQTIWRETSWTLRLQRQLLQSHDESSSDKRLSSKYIWNLYCIESMREHKRL